MTIRSRKWLFYGLTAIFAILSSALIFYSNDWRLDLETLKIDKLGALFIEAYPDGASIEIEKANFIIKPGLFKNTILVANLFPKIYSIKIFKDNYQTWIKNFEVKPSLVTDTYPIVLMPQNPTLKLKSEKIQNIWTGPETLAWKNQTGNLIINNKIISGTEIIDWSSNNNSVITFDSKNKMFFLINLSGNITINLNLMVKNSLNNEKVIAVKFHPTEAQIILSTDKGLYNLNLDSLLLTKINSTPAEKIIAENNKIFWIYKNKLYSLNQNITDHDLILKTLEKELVLNNSYLKFSPDKNKLAVLLNENGRAKIKIYFLNDDEKLKHKKGDVETIDSGFAEGNLKFEWHQNSYYLFMQSGDYLSFMEIDGKPPVNVQIISNNTQKFQYDSKNDLLYVLSDSSLYEINLK